MWIIQVWLLQNNVHYTLYRVAIWDGSVFDNYKRFISCLYQNKKKQLLLVKSIQTKYTWLGPLSLKYDCFNFQHPRPQPFAATFFQILTSVSLPSLQSKSCNKFVLIPSPPNLCEDRTDRCQLWMIRKSFSFILELKKVHIQGCSI